VYPVQPAAAASFVQPRRDVRRELRVPIRAQRVDGQAPAAEGSIPGALRATRRERHRRRHRQQRCNAPQGLRGLTAETRHRPRHKFRQFYTDDIALVADFFSAAAFESVFPRQKAKIVTSIAMFYDLERPVDFVRDVASILAPEGIWHFEQSYMPSMLRTNSYDTICHEHLEFYSLGVVSRILAEAGLHVIDVEMNAVNGGSFAVTAAHEGSSHASNRAMIEWMLRQEHLMGLDSPRPYKEFERRVFDHRTSLKELIESLVADGKRVLGYGASTKGNVLLQFCGLTTRHIECIAEVNEDKFGAFTPGTNIPIVSEKEARAMEPDYFLVLPWHFKSSILERERDYLTRGGKFIFPMPEIEIV
jgi:hypothetical protein